MHLINCRNCIFMQFTFTAQHTSALLLLCSFLSFSRRNVLCFAGLFCYSQLVISNSLSAHTLARLSTCFLENILTRASVAYMRKSSGVMMKIHPLYISSRLSLCKTIEWIRFFLRTRMLCGTKLFAARIRIFDEASVHVHATDSSNCCYSLVPSHRLRGLHEREKIRCGL